ncbi:uncharacterized protein LOC123317165 [Coccinella septempunctata]|uniref:uncharacterized protein LOC123317165 n=1 Tax=Coccinella septempunctata TaxID=41139 RepID=UPI001D061939|nr:uncharacterized protein LOC123317165 [Coccinella septempunctata]
MFAVVQFITESTSDNVSVSEVPTSWISTDQKQCWWPPSNTTIYIARQKKPNPETWKLYPIKVECYCETYQEAKKKALSITSSDEETVRTLKPNRRYNPSQYVLNYSDEANNNNNAQFLPIAPMSLNPISRPISTIEEISEDTRSSSTVNTEPTVLDISDYRLNYVESPGGIPESEMSEKSRKQNVENCHNCCHNSDVIIKLLTELTLKVDELKETIGANSQVSLNSEAVNFITSKLPCKNIEELEYLESLVYAEKKHNESLIYIMTSIGGTTGRHFTQRVLKKLLTNEVAELCSWTGASTILNFRN